LRGALRGGGAGETLGPWPSWKRASRLAGRRRSQPAAPCRSGPRRFVPSFVPDAGGDAAEGGADRFEVAPADAGGAQAPGVAYGLNVRARPGAGGGGAARAPPPAAPARPAAPVDREAEAFAADLARLPPEADADAYAAMPVSAFGEALLRGMGWEAGRGLGRARGGGEEVVAKDLVRRPARLGLGAAPPPPPERGASGARARAPAPGGAPARDLVYVDPASGAVRSAAPLGAALGERPGAGPAPGARMRVAAGRHAGLACEVVALEAGAPGRSARARVRLLPSHEDVSVRVSELEAPGAGTGAGAGEARRRAGSERGGGERERRRDGGGEREQRRGGGRGGRERAERGASDGSDGGGGGGRRAPWLRAGIRVKVVDKRAGGGRLYLKTGVVADVPAPRRADVYVEALRESFLGLRESQLETSVPRAEGAPVAVVAGPLAGRRGRLLARGAGGAAAVQLAGDLSVHRLALDDLAGWAGGPDGE
jgi:G patch domain/KOW motif-containing protein